MNPFPAIDLRSGHVVRLTEGDYDRMTVYSSSPLDVARRFEADGAEYLHMVDLDGALQGKPENRTAIEEVAKNTSLFIQVGGGIRTEERIYDYLQMGVQRVILGTIAVQNFPFVEKMVSSYDSHIAVGVDARDGYVAVNGWTEKTVVPAIDFCKRLRDVGVSTVIYTDISCDGMLSGTNLHAYRMLGKITGLQIVASGGISFEHEITELAGMGIYGAIVGKALYTERLQLPRLLTLAKGV